MQLSDSYSLQHLSDKKAYLNDIKELRKIVWEQGAEDIVGSNYFLDEYDDEAEHWIILDGKIVVGAGRLTIHNSISMLPDAFFYEGIEEHFQPPIAAITRLVIHPSHQRRGLAKAIDRERIDFAKRQSVRCIAADCPAYRINSLKKLDFELVRELTPAKGFDRTKFAVMKLEL